MGAARLTLAALALAACCARAGEMPQPVASGVVVLPAGPQDELGPVERARIWSEIRASQARLSLPKAGTRPSFQWPLRAARGYSDPGFDTIANFVDHDPAFPSQLKDYNCGARSYDQASGYNHRGIDISLWPDSWNLMDARQIEVVAAAPGTIVLKSDGNFDRNCRFNDSAQWNAVYVQHDDGSVAWYGHLLNGSLTTKPIGARVAAGEYLGNVGSSGNSSGPHLHLEVYDASHNLVDPYAGPCNTRNSESWWATQPAYRRTQVNRVMTASAVPQFPVCGASGINESTGNLHGVNAFVPGSTVYFVALVRELPTTEALTYTVYQPDGAVFSQYTTATAPQFAVAAAFQAGFALPPTAPEGLWRVEATLAGTLARHTFAVNASATVPPNYTALWWNAAESGWGLNLVHQGDILFATWFTYDTDRGGLWLVMSDARRQPDGSYSGTIYRTTGTPLAQINGSAATTGPPASVGTGTLRFASGTQATFSYSVNGVNQQKTITRQAFSTPSTCSSSMGPRTHATNYQDLWWNPAESGWGINFAHQGDILFATWFTYGAGGRGQWLVASDLRRQPTGEFRGRLYRTTGTPFDQINGAPAVTASDVGEMTVTFSDGEHARMDYTVDGTTQSKTITRQVFGTTTPLCR